MLGSSASGELLHIHHWVDSGVDLYCEALPDPVEQGPILLATLTIINDVLRGSCGRRSANRQHSLRRIRILRSCRATTLQELKRRLLNALELLGEELESLLGVSDAVRVAHVRVKSCRVRALRGFESVRKVTELSFAYGDAGAVVADIDFDEDWDLAGPGFFRDAVE